MKRRASPGASSVKPAQFKIVITDAAEPLPSSGWEEGTFSRPYFKRPLVYAAAWEIRRRELRNLRPRRVFVLDLSHGIATEVGAGYGVRSRRR